MKANYKSKIKSFIITGLTLILNFYILFPIYILIITSLKEEVQTFSWPPVFLFAPKFDAYYNVLFTGSSGLGLYFPKYFLNSFVVAVGGSLLGMALGLPVAYALVRFPIKNKNATLYSFLSIRFAPFVIASIAFLFMWNRLGLLDTHLGLLLPYGMISLPFVVLIMTSFMKQVPGDVIDSSIVDGCSDFQTMVRIVLPLVMPGLVATMILTTIFNWNEFPLAFLLTYESARTVPVAIPPLAGSTSGIRWDLFTAAGTLAIVPMIVLVFLIQRHLVRGLTLGAVR